jgi:hypothetical protein
MARRSNGATTTRRASNREEHLDALSAWQDALANGDDWFQALLAAISRWEPAEETVNGRCYQYLIGGEAFDWLLLAERLCDEANGAIPAEEREALLFFGRAPRQLDDQEFHRAIGPAKHRAHLNFLYGVTVEEALQLAVEQEVHKERHAFGGVSEGQTIDDVIFERIYARPRHEMLAEYCDASGLLPADEMSYSELRSFTYWLFKYRISQSDPARVASDTRKALAQVSALEAASRRRLQYWDERGVHAGPVVDGEVVAHVR